MTISTQNRGEQLEYDRVRGIDNTLGYLFFTKQDSAIALYELSLVHQEIKTNGAVQMPALMNAICEFDPAYTAMHNEQAAKYGNGGIISRTPGLAADYIRF